MSKEALLSFLKSHPFVLAPMAGITDSPFRQLMRRFGAPIVVTELVSATGLRYESAKTRQLLAFKSEEKIIGAQFFGSDVKDLIYAAKVAQDLGYDFVDLNCGCPVAKVVTRGAGSALLKVPEQLASIVEAMVKSVQIPVTVKIRTGWDSNSLNADKVANLAFEAGALWVAIHGRTRCQGYQGLADWDYISKVAQVAKGPIIGNGDIVTPEMALNRLKNSRCMAVMIGRGALKDPFIFRKSYNLWKNQSYSCSNFEDYRQFFDLMWEIFESSYNKKIAEIQLKKMLVWMATGYPHASDFRRLIYSKNFESQELKDLAFGFFEKFLRVKRFNEDNQGFLMGGHG